MIKQFTKEEAIKLINDNQITVYYEEYWRYPETGDDQKTCPMLNMMFNIEMREGFVIHIIPNVKQPPKVAALTKKDVYGGKE